MRHPSKHRFFSRFLVPDQVYSDSAGGIFWTANRSTKTRTFQNGSKCATWKMHAKSQHTAEFGKKTARIRGWLVHKSWSFQKLCQVREIVSNRMKTLRFFCMEKMNRSNARSALWTFFCRRAKILKWRPKVNRKNASSDCKSHVTSAILKIRCVSFFSFRSFVLASFHFVSFRFVRRPTGLIHPNTRSPAPAACTGINLKNVFQCNYFIWNSMFNLLQYKNWRRLK